MKFLALFTALKSRQFACLWTGQTISRLGDSIYRLALIWWAMEKTGSATAIGGVLIATFVPTIMFSLLAGVMVDRFSRVRVMLLSDILRGVIVGVVAFLAFTKSLEIWHVYVCSILFGMVAAFFQPAYKVITTEILASDNLPSANSLTALTSQITSVAGPVIGAWVIASGGTSMAFALNATSFFLSAIFLLPLLTTVSPKPSIANRPTVWADLREGIQTVAASPWLWITITAGILANATLNGPLAVALPLLINQQLHMGVEALATLQSSMAVGSLLSAILLGRLARIRHRGWSAYLFWIATGMMALVLGLPVVFVMLTLAMFALGFALTGYTLVWTNILQDLVPRDRLGRVSSIDLLGNLAFLPLGYGVTGWLTGVIGIPAVFILGGGITALMAIIGLFHPSIRQLD